mmetsp:Transcript_38169/g.85496  ORF Transcript_38169/g.85496 Transcript_38169/m.85496 type:complete len:291 (-) Transcript_38169:4011-4883(-)
MRRHRAHLPVPPLLPVALPRAIPPHRPVPPPAVHRRVAWLQPASISPLQRSLARAPATLRGLLDLSLLIPLPASARSAAVRPLRPVRKHAVLGLWAHPSVHQRRISRLVARRHVTQRPGARRPQHVSVALDGPRPGGDAIARAGTPAPVVPSAEAAVHWVGARVLAAAGVLLERPGTGRATVAGEKGLARAEAHAAVAGGGARGPIGPLEPGAVHHGVGVARPSVAWSDLQCPMRIARLATSCSMLRNAAGPAPLTATTLHSAWRPGSPVLPPAIPLLLARVLSAAPSLI